MSILTIPGGENILAGCVGSAVLLFVGCWRLGKFLDGYYRRRGVRICGRSGTMTGIAGAYMGNARNIRLQPVEGETGKIVPDIELLIFLTAKDWRIDGVGQPVMDYRLETLRMAISPEGCRQLAEKLNEMATEAEKLAANWVEAT